MTMEWIFEKTPPMGGAAGQAFNNPLVGQEDPPTLLAREAIQNSCDASLRDTKVHVDFRIRELRGNDKRQFLESFGFVDHFIPRIAKVRLNVTNCLRSLKEDSVPLRLLYIEDFGTCGLYGDPHDSENSHFYRLLLSLGDDTKVHESRETGGSYGFGKTVFSSNSNIKTIIVYTSYISPAGETGVRLMGCAFLDNHNHLTERFTGRAWLGEKNSDGSIVDPFKGPAASSLAKELGFGPREGGKTGTSILIVDCPIALDDLKKSIETYWWPRICENNLDIDLFDGDQLLSPPRPRKREELKPFIECFDLALGRAEPAGEHQKAASFYKLNGRELGRYGYQTVIEDLAEKECLREFMNRVALIREPRMVVAYENVGRNYPPSVGVLVADKGIDNELRFSEPATHSRWDPTSSRLSQAPPEVREVVKAVMNRLRQSFVRFQSETAPPQPRGERRLRLLERDLGAFFKALTGPVPPPPREVDPVSIQFQHQPHPISVDGKLATAAKFSVELMSRAKVDFAKPTLTVKVVLLMDDNSAEGDPLRISLESIDSKISETGTESIQVPISLTKGEPIKFDLTTEPYDPKWSTRVILNILEQARTEA
jgi:hypothetical protein